MARGKCVVCEKKNVDISLPSGLVCTYCDAHFHSECSPTFAKIDSEVLVVVKKVCAPCLDVMSYRSMYRFVCVYKLWQMIYPIPHFCARYSITTVV